MIKEIVAQAKDRFDFVFPLEIDRIHFFVTIFPLEKDENYLFVREENGDYKVSPALKVIIQCIKKQGYNPRTGLTVLFKYIEETNLFNFYDPQATDSLEELSKLFLCIYNRKKNDYKTEVIPQSVVEKEYKLQV